jgi:hypothetical protein
MIALFVYSAVSMLCQDGSPCSVGLMVPASTFMYGSILIAVTFNPVIFNRRPVDEAICGSFKISMAKIRLVDTNQ